MNLKSLVESLSTEEKEQLLDLLTENTDTWTTMPPHVAEELEKDVEETPKRRVEEDFTMHKPSSLKTNGRREAVRAGKNTWTDTGEHKDVQTPEVERTPRNRASPKKKKVRCHICGKDFTVNANLVYGEYYRCDRCTG